MYTLHKKIKDIKLEVQFILKGSVGEDKESSTHNFLVLPTAAILRRTDIGMKSNKNVSQDTKFFKKV